MPERRMPLRQGDGRRRTTFRLRTYIALPVAAFVLAGALGAFFVHREAERITLRSTRQEAHASADAAAHLVLVGLESVWKGLYRAAARPDAVRAAANPDFCRASFVQLAAFPTGHVDILRPDGSVVCTSLGARAAHPPTGYTGEPWLDEARTLPQARAVVVDRATGRPTALLTMPLAGGVAAVFLDLAPVGRVLGREFASGPGEDLVVTTGDGRTILTRSGDEPRWVGRGVAGTPFATVARGGRSDGHGVDGVRRLYERVDVPGVDWRVYVGGERARAVAAAEDVSVRGLRIIALGLVLVFAAALYMLRRVVRPLVVLRDAVRATSPGQELPVVATRAPFEVAALTEDFRTLTSAVRRELTDRRNAEHAARLAAEEARLSEQMYRMLFETNPQPMWVFDDRTRAFVEANKATTRTYGYDRDELAAMTVDDLRPPGDAPWFVPAPGDLATYVRSGPWSHRKKDGTVIDVELTSYPVDRSGRPGRFVMAEDVTERARLQRKLNQTQRLESLGQLAGGVAHDFNNLLAVIINYASFVAEEVDRAAAGDGASWRAVQEDLQQITRAAKRATELTHQLLAFARRDVARPDILDLNDVVAGVESFLGRTLGERVELVTTLGTDLWPVLADAGQLEQVLVNLAVNARDAMPDGGTLTIETANTEVDEHYAATAPNLVPGRYVRVRVSDTGTGMDADVVQHAFEPFFTTKPAGEGTGLGLATVYGIVTQAGGQVQIYSEPGLGTTFSVLLPATDEPLATQAVAPPAPPGRRGGETVLVVEDEPAIREVARRILTRNGYAVLTAAGGAEAVDVARQHEGPLDLVVTDVVMPQKLGKEVAKEVQAVRPGVRVLYMSGYAQPVLAQQGTLEPGVILVEKPFSEEQLLAKVREALTTPR